MLGDNATDAEVLEYGTTDQKLARFEQMVSDAPGWEAELKAVEAKLKKKGEQLHHADLLLAEIRTICREETRAVTIKQRIKVAFDNSYYEE